MWYGSASNHSETKHNKDMIGYFMDTPSHDVSVAFSHYSNVIMILWAMFHIYVFAMSSELCAVNALFFILPFFVLMLSFEISMLARGVTFILYSIHVRLYYYNADTINLLLPLCDAYQFYVQLSRDVIVLIFFLILGSGGIACLYLSKITK